MEFEVGGTYEFTGMHNGKKGTLILKFLKEEIDGYYRIEAVGGTFTVEKDIGMVRTLNKNSGIVRTWKYKRIYTKEEQFTTEYDPAGKGIKLNYRDPKLLDLYIDMALATNDKQWFNILVKAKERLVNAQ